MVVLYRVKKSMQDIYVSHLRRRYDSLAKARVPIPIRLVLYQCFRAAGTAAVRLHFFHARCVYHAHLTVDTLTSIFLSTIGFAHYPFFYNMPITPSFPRQFFQALSPSNILSVTPPPMLLNYRRS